AGPPAVSGPREIPDRTDPCGEGRRRARRRARAVRPPMSRRDNDSADQTKPSSDIKYLGDPPRARRLHRSGPMCRLFSWIVLAPLALAMGCGAETSVTF